MKTVSKHEQEDIQEIKNVVRQLFELQLQLEDRMIENQNEDLMIKAIIELLDGLFEKIMQYE